MRTAQYPTPGNTRQQIISSAPWEARAQSSELTFEYWADPPDWDGALAVELAQDELHVEEREGAEGEHEDVGDEEGSASILVTQVGKPPDVGEIHSEPDDAQEKVKIAAPGLSFSILSLVDIIFHYITSNLYISDIFHPTARSSFTLFILAWSFSAAEINSRTHQPPRQAVTRHSVTHWENNL